MSIPKIFISSTCYDLGTVREQLRTFILNLGYEPVMSEYSDILYDFRIHTHTSCLNEIQNVDMLIVLVGRRFGGQSIPEALSLLDIENLEKASFDTSILDNPEKLSVTQLEVLKAIEHSIPVFAFVEETVMHDHYVYKKNKDLSDKITYPSIEKQETAKYIFGFVDFLQHRIKGNGLITFSKIEDIENHLRKQWASLFQRLLKEQKESTNNYNQMFTISEQIEDIKTALISMTNNNQNKEVAKGTIKYRRLINFLSGLIINDLDIISNSTDNFDQLLTNIGIDKKEEIQRSRYSFGRTALIKKDGTFFELRYPLSLLNNLSREWQTFISLPTDVRKIISEAIVDMDETHPMSIRYRNLKYSDYIEEIEQKSNDLLSESND